MWRDVENRIQSDLKAIFRRHIHQPVEVIQAEGRFFVVGAEI